MNASISHYLSVSIRHIMGTNPTPLCSVPPEAALTSSRSTEAAQTSACSRAAQGVTQPS